MSNSDLSLEDISRLFHAQLHAQFPGARFPCAISVTTPRYTFGDLTIQDSLPSLEVFPDEIPLSLAPGRVDPNRTAFRLWVNSPGGEWEEEEAVSEAVSEHLLNEMGEVVAIQESEFDRQIRDQLRAAIGSQGFGLNAFGLPESELSAGSASSCGIATSAPPFHCWQEPTITMESITECARAMQSMAQRMQAPIRSLAQRIEDMGRMLGGLPLTEPVPSYLLANEQEAFQIHTMPWQIHLEPATPIPPVNGRMLIDVFRELANLTPDANIVPGRNPNTLHQRGDAAHANYCQVSREIVGAYHVPEIPWTAIFCDCGRTYQLRAEQKDRIHGDIFLCQCGRPWNLFNREWERFGEADEVPS